VYVLTVLFSFLFLYHLDYTTLTSWDEAWYANIARTIVQSGDWMNMKWIGEPFYDHPPLGMWLMALSFKLLGVGETSARLPSVVLGVGTLLLVYATGLQMFKRKSVGFAAALVLGSAVWFVARARSGNLDTMFTFFYMASVYCALRARDDARWFVAMGCAFAGLIMSKTLIGVSALPLMLYASFPMWAKPKAWKYLAVGAILWSMIVLPWYMHQRASHPEFWHHHFTEIGTRNRDSMSYFDFDPAPTVMFYVHMGIRKWYKIWFLALAWLAFRTITDKKQRRNNIFLLLWNAGILFPFISSEKSELWHLIPVYLPISLIIAYGVWDFFEMAFLFCKKHCPLRSHSKEIYISVLYVMCFSFLALWQVKTFWAEIIPEYPYESERVQITKAIQKYPGRHAYLDDDFLPEAIFYAGRDLTPVSEAANDDPEYKNKLVGLFRTDEQDFIVVTRWWTTGKLDDMKLPYTVLEQNKDFKLISRP
jgi:4-amino-4-deoxy-L-arabinose transferase-like glycosyltransferase